MSTHKFWIVMSAMMGPSRCPYRHSTEQSAFEEARRLASTHGGTFYVLAAQGAASKQDVIVAKFDDNEEIPF